MTSEEFMEEYIRLGHAIQTGVAYEMNRSNIAEPKHLRTGLNCVMADLGSMTRLLVKKGIISEDEYYEAIIEGLKKEVADSERRLKDLLGMSITLL